MSLHPYETRESSNTELISQLSFRHYTLTYKPDIRNARGYKELVSRGESIWKDVLKILEGSRSNFAETILPLLLEDLRHEKIPAEINRFSPEVTHYCLERIKAILNA